MNPFPKPIRALYRPPSGDEIVAIVATSEDEYLAIAHDGTTVVDLHGRFVVQDWEILSYADEGS